MHASEFCRDTSRSRKWDKTFPLLPHLTLYKTKNRSSASFHLVSVLVMLRRSNPSRPHRILIWRLNCSLRLLDSAVMNSSSLFGNEICGQYESSSTCTYFPSSTAFW